MRALTAIVAAVLSVTTGGALRCPCQLAPLFRPVAVATPDAPQPEKSPCRSCPCHAHEEPDSREPVAPEPGPGRPPCPHGPGVDVTPPPAGSDRVGDDAATALEHQALAPRPGAPVARLAPAGTTLPPPPDHLRYCHAFRC